MAQAQHPGCRQRERSRLDLCSDAVVAALTRLYIRRESRTAGVEN